MEYALLPAGEFLVFQSVKTRTQPLTPIRLRMDANNEHIRLSYQGDELGEEGEVLEEVISILQENGEEGFEGIYRGLKERGLKVGGNRLREILKKATGKELVEDRGPKGKRIYRLSPVSQFHAPI